MNTSKTIDGVTRDDLHELHVVLCNMEVQDGSEYADIRDRLRALLDAPEKSAGSLISVKPDVLRALFAPNANAVQLRDAKDAARKAYEDWSIAGQNPAAQPQGEPVAHCLLRRNGSGNWVNDSKCWVNGLPGQQIVDECEKHPDLYRLRFAYAEQPAPQKYDDTLMPFLALMRKELHANSHKGDREGWLGMPLLTAMNELTHHHDKLGGAVEAVDAPQIAEYAADVANCAMMLADVCGLLTKDQE